MLILMIRDTSTFYSLSIFLIIIIFFIDLISKAKFNKSRRKNIIYSGNVVSSLNGLRGADGFYFKTEGESIFFRSLLYYLPINFNFCLSLILSIKRFVIECMYVIFGNCNY